MSISRTEKAMVGLSTTLVFAAYMMCLLKLAVGA